jgi:hypothetical protein
LLKEKKRPAEIVEELYYATLSRPPRADELARDAGWLAKAPSLRDGAHDLLWVLLNRCEFQFAP